MLASTRSYHKEIIVQLVDMKELCNDDYIAHLPRDPNVLNQLLKVNMHALTTFHLNTLLPRFIISRVGSGKV